MDVEEDTGLGFSGMELFNLVLLGRRVWRLLQDSSTSSARILKVVYFPNGYILSAEFGSHPSQVWRSMCEGRYVMCVGLVRRMGNGRITDA